MSKSTYCYKKIIFICGILFMTASLILSVCLFISPDKPTLSFLPLEFTFSSGVGGWQTTLTLNQDGAFTGVYGDSEMGARDTDYPNGTQYICEFSGKFQNFKKVNDYTFSMTLADIETKCKEGEEWIEDGVKYIAASPYGIDESREFLLYTPQTPASELWDDFFVFSNLQKNEKLSRYAICNTTTSSYFFSDPITTEPYTEIKTATTENPLADNELKAIFEPLIKKGENVHESINNDLADIEMEDKIAFTLENGGYEYHYQLITDENFKTLDDVWQFAYSAYTHEAAERLFSDHLDQQGTPRFLERDGKLYYYKSGHGYKSDFNFDSLQIISQFDNTVILSIDNYGFGTDENAPDKCIFIMQNTKNGWRLANSVSESYNIVRVSP